MIFAVKPRFKTLLISTLLSTAFQSAANITVSSPNGGESIAGNQLVNITWTSDSAGNVNIDLLNNNILHHSIAQNETNDGTYSWQVPNGIDIDSLYSIRITSVDDNNDTDTSNANFAAVTEVFPTGGVVPSGFTQSSGSTKSWIVATDQVIEGSYSLKSDSITHRQSASIERTGEFQAGNLTFHAKVSSEASFDFLKFYIDGVEQQLSSAGNFRRGIAGEIDWAPFSFSIPAGTHTFKWEYSKDGSVSNGSDAAWIDNLVLPAETP